MFTGDPGESVVSAAPVVTAESTSTSAAVVAVGLESDASRDYRLIMETMSGSSAQNYGVRILTTTMDTYTRRVSVAVEDVVAVTYD